MLKRNVDYMGFLLQTATCRQQTLIFYVIKVRDLNKNMYRLMSEFPPLISHAITLYLLLGLADYMLCVYYCSSKAKLSS